MDWKLGIHTFGTIFCCSLIYYHFVSSVVDFPENVASMSSLDKDSQYAAMENKWELPTLAPELASLGDKDVEKDVDKDATPVRPRPQSFAQKLRSTGKTVKGKLGEGGCIFHRLKYLSVVLSGLGGF